MADGAEQPRVNIKTSAVKTPSFTGETERKEVAETFLTTARIYHTAQNFTDDEDRVDSMLLCLDGEAARWFAGWRTTARETDVYTWAQFLIDFRARFCPPDSMRDESVRLAQIAMGPTERVRAFWDRCLIVTQQTAPFSISDPRLAPVPAADRRRIHAIVMDKLQVRLFTRNLREPIRAKLFDVQSWQTAEECLTAAVNIEKNVRDKAKEEALKAGSLKGYIASAAEQQPPAASHDDASAEPPDANVAAARRHRNKPKRGSRDPRFQFRAQPVYNGYIPGTAPGPPRSVAAAGSELLEQLSGMFVHAAKADPRRQPPPPHSARPRAPPHPQQEQTHRFPIKCFYCHGTFHTEATCRAKAEDNAAFTVSAAHAADYHEEQHF